MRASGAAIDDRIALSTAHWLNDENNSHASYGLSDTSPTPLADSFHVYGITWDERYVRAFRNGKQFWVIDITPPGLSEFHQPFFLLVNAAVGGTPLGITNPDQVTAALPQTMQVDYIRVYQEAAGARGGAKEKSGIREFSAVMHPAGTSVTLMLTGGRGPLGPALSLYTVDGKLLVRRQPLFSPDGRYTIDLPAQMAQGVYLVEMKTGAECLRCVLLPTSSSADYFFPSF
ncbi:MAG: glycoside hydrolase family 16 protein [Chitinispirillaceae bacterium]|nr:glycoside hydrolase family 16 protein [Chitinispirillaceae bacterium]